jgi:hypothetical protein
MPTLVVRSLIDPEGISSAERRLASLQSAEGLAPPPHPTWSEAVKQLIRVRLATLKESGTFNFDQMTWTPSAALPLLLLAIGALVFSLIDGSTRFVAAANTGIWLRWIQYSAATLLCLAGLANEVVVARFLSADGSLDRSTVMEIRTLQSALVLIGLALLLWKRQLADLLRRVVVRQSETSGDVLDSNRTLFALALVVPWLVLVMVVEAGYAVRYFWLWPLQVILIAAAVTYVPERLGWPRPAAWVAQVAVTLILLTHPWVISPVQAWVRSGWSGPRANDIQAVDYIASELRAEGRTRAAIGYQTFMVGFMATMNTIDPRYKVGTELDLFLKHRYGITNSNQCAEGVSADDEYRIVQEPPQQAGSPEVPPSWAPLGSEVKSYDLVEYFKVPLDPSFRLLRRFGQFQVFRRNTQ